MLTKQKRDFEQRETVNRGRHVKLCSICKHARRDEIESDFVGWRSPSQIARSYSLSDRSSLYRHARVFDLFAKRRRNIRAALEHIIEKAAEVEVGASAIVAAIQAYAKINGQGLWIERSEATSVHELFERMSEAEMEEYARSGKLPKWFAIRLDATLDSQEPAND
jgi:murein L,D-transpeptidase YcbB/YkuD